METSSYRGSSPVYPIQRRSLGIPRRVRHLPTRWPTPARLRSLWGLMAKLPWVVLEPLLGSPRLGRCGTMARRCIPKRLEHLGNAKNASRSHADDRSNFPTRIEPHLGSVQEDDERSFEADRSGSENFQSGPKHELPDFGEPQEKSGAEKNRHYDDLPSNSMLGSSEYDPNPSGPSGSSQSHDPESKRPNPFESLGEFPQDVKDAVEQFKLCILRHRASQWQEITRDDLIAALDALRAFC